jgi:hypothetical protein
VLNTTESRGSARNKESQKGGLTTSGLAIYSQVSAMPKLQLPIITLEVHECATVNRARGNSRAIDIYIFPCTHSYRFVSEM